MYEQNLRPLNDVKCCNNNCTLYNCTNKAFGLDCTTHYIHNILIVTCYFGHILPFSCYDAQQKSYPVTKAGPSALAGLMHMELTGPRIHMSRQIAKGTAKGPNFPQPLQTGSFSDIQLSCTRHATGTQNTDTMLCLIFIYCSQSYVATCSPLLQGLL